MFVKLCNKKTLVFAETNKKVNTDRNKIKTNKQFLSKILYQKNNVFTNFK